MDPEARVYLKSGEAARIMASNPAGENITEISNFL